MMIIDIEDFAGIPFKWGGNNPEIGLDCYTLANYLRRAHELIELPSMPLYKNWDEDKHPPNYVLRMLNYHAENVPCPEDFDLMLLGTHRGGALGTVYGGRVLHFAAAGNSTWSSLGLAQRISLTRPSYWRYPGNEQNQDR